MDCTWRRMVYGGSYETVIFHFYRLRCGKVIFSQASVILFTGRGGAAAIPPRTHTPRIYTPSGRHTPWADTPLGHDPPGRHTPGHTPLWTDTQPLEWLLQRTVRILLECILVIRFFLRMVTNQNQSISKSQHPLLKTHKF